MFLSISYRLVHYVSNPSNHCFVAGGLTSIDNLFVHRTYIKSATEELVVVIVMGCIEPEPPHTGAGGRLLEVAVPEHCRDQHQHKEDQHFLIERCLKTQMSFHQ